jgi:two-component system, cell cycle sensor histidine kinase and response regulator CckA
MNERLRVLIIEDDCVDAELMVRELERAGFVPEWSRVETEEEYLASLEKGPEIILSDSSLPLFDGLDALDLLQQRGLDIPFILVSGRVGEDRAVDAMKRGACDYLLKDRLARLGEAVRRAVEERRLRDEKAWAVEALRQSEERYRLISEISSDYVYSLRVEPDGRLTCDWVTDPFTRITGVTPAEINPKGWKSLYHVADLAVIERHYETLRSGRPDSIEVRIVTKGQKTRWIRIHDRPLPGKDTVERIYGAAQDITVQKQLEEQLLQTGKMEAIGQLAGGVAHDFNNLLTVIRGYGDLLKRQQDLTPESHEHVEEILEAARRASDLTKQLLAFGRGQVLEFRNVNLNTVMEGIETLLSRLIGEDLELKIIRGADLGLVKADPGQLEQVIMNLVVNARDAMLSGGKLTIETANTDLNEDETVDHGTIAAGPYVTLTVKDTGLGMDPDTLARAFEPFFTTKDPGKGTGLGLAMVYGIVKQSGGEIRVVTALAQGTTFEIYFPRLANAVETVAGSAPFTLRRVPPRKIAGGSETVLVLEDEPALRVLIRQVLSVRGYKVLDTSDPNEAIRICERRGRKIDLLITDVIMPKMSGPQVVDRVAGMCPGMRILYTSGYTGNALKNHGFSSASLNHRGISFFAKPFTPDALAKKVRQMLDEKLA